MKRNIFLSLLVALLLLGGVGGAYIASAEGSTRTAAFIEMLIKKGIIPQNRAERARALADFLLGTKKEDARAMNAEHVAVDVSQYIAHANRVYKEGDPIEGLLLRVRNTSTSTIDLEGRRKCHMSYKILTEDRARVLYDSAASSTICQSGERVHYYIEPGGHRTFPLTHAPDAYRLPRGTYIFELEYPEYGKGERTITVE